MPAIVPRRVPRLQPLLAATLEPFAALGRVDPVPPWLADAGMADDSLPILVAASASHATSAREWARSRTCQPGRHPTAENDETRHAGRVPEVPLRGFEPRFPP